MAIHYQPKVGEAKVFDNKLLELLSKAPAFIAYTYYPAVILFFLFVNLYWRQIGWVNVIITFVAAYLFWSFFEYVAHRWAFHFTTKNKIVKTIVHMAHGVHHEFPKDTNRLIMPPLPWTVLVSLLLGLSFLIGGDYAFTWMAGMLAGYLSYIFVHYQVHLNRPPKFLRKLMVHHALHHYKYDDLAFGVSSTFWDRIFRTMPPKK